MSEKMYVLLRNTKCVQSKTQVVICAEPGWHWHLCLAKHMELDMRGVVRFVGFVNLLFVVNNWFIYRSGNGLIIWNRNEATNLFLKLSEVLIFSVL